MIAFANCKINIGLNIVARRTDGYHDIVTAMVPVPWHDILEAIPAKGPESTLTVLGNKVDCAIEDNLVMKACRLMEAEYGIGATDLILQKLVPDGAGLGGGSSDAAHTLHLLNQVHSLGLSKDELARLASRLGADCPFFIYGGEMLATGTGVELEPLTLDLHGLWLAIAKPQGVSISTKMAYGGIKPQKPVCPLSELLLLPVKEWQGRVVNDFEPSVFAIAPEIGLVKETMLRHGAIYAAMSGSGASVFGLFETDKLTEQCVNSLSGCITFHTRL